jgi:FKBP-type peptidyl-prolyl cis-trans isomerase FkpA
MIKRYLYVLLAFSCILIVSCSKDGDSDIEAYLERKNLTAQVTNEGLYYIIDVPGNQAKKPKINSDVVVAYKGTLLNDIKFDSSANFSVNLSKVIAGWRKGMVLFGEGGKGKLIIPPSLGYGSNAQDDIPANSALVFEIELKEVVN